MIRSEQIQIPVPTNATLKGPRLTHDENRVTVAYDCERSDGTVVWAELVFDEVLAIEYRTSVCCEGEHVVAPSYIARYTESAWLSRTRELWSASVGWQKYEQSKGGAERFSHYRLYFDDAACIQLIAAALRIAGTSSEEAVPSPSPTH